jgi:large repetitive protein
MRRTHMLSFRGLYLAFSLVALSGCLEAGSGSSSGSVSQCAAPFEKVILAAEVKGSKHVYFNIEDFSFLDTEGLVIDSVTLDVVLKGKHGTVNDHSLSFNGFKAARRDGGSTSDSMNYDEVRQTSHGNYKLHKFYLNGALIFSSFLAKIRKDKGELKLSLNGTNIHVISAVITVHGEIHTKCPEPTASPTPVPVPPTTIINSVVPNDNPTSSQVITFEFSSNNSGNTLMCSLDGAPAVECRSPQSYQSLASGSHTFAVHSVSREGLSDVLAPSYSWVIDAVAPVVMIDGAWSSNSTPIATLTNSDAVQFTFSSSETGTFYCKLDDQPEQVCSSPTGYQFLTEGGHAFEVAIVDAVGNRSLSPARFAWTIDRTVPVMNIVSVDPASAITNSTSKTFQFEANESSLYECSIDNGAFSACTSPLAVGGVAEGNHWFEVRATDVVGNQGLPVSYSWTVDLTAPVITFGSMVPAAGNTNASAITAEFMLSEASESVCDFDGQSAPCNSPFAASVTSEGLHVLSVGARDLAGNQALEATVSWTMDFSAPLISFGAITPSASQYVASQTLSLEVNSNESIQFSSTLDGVDLGQNVSPISVDQLDEGAHNITVVGRDSVGNISNTISHDFVVDITAPTLTFAVADSTSPSRLDTRAFSFSANEAASFNCQFDASGFSLCVSPADLSGIADGDHLYEVRATDLAGNQSSIASHAWSVDTVAPTTALAATQTGASISFVLSSSESPATFECSLDSAAYATCSTPVNYSALSPGDHFFSVRSSDLAGNTDPIGASHSWIVVDPVTTTMTSIAVTAPITSVNWNTFEFSSNQADATFICSLNGAAPTACSSPINYFGLADNNYTFAVRAVDRYGNLDPAGASYSWTVDTVAPAILTQSVSVTNSSITVNWTTNEAATSRLFWGRDPAFDRDTGETSSFVTSHSIRIAGLTRATNYTVQISGRDRAGNVYLGPKKAVKTAN